MRRPSDETARVIRLPTGRWKVGTSAAAQRVVALFALALTLLTPQACGDGPTAPRITITDPSLRGGVVGVPYADTLNATGGSRTKRWTVLSGALPPGLTLLSSGVLSGTPATAGSYTAEIAVTSGGRKRTQSYTIIIIPSLQLTTTSLRNGLEGTPYADTLAATGGLGAYVWSLSSGALPAGLTLTAAGVLSGTPTAAGTFNLTLQVTSGTQTATRAVSLLITPSLAVSTLALAEGIVGQPYADTLRAIGASGALNWGVQSGALPAGLTLLSSGALSGTPTTSGTSDFTVQVSSGAQTASRALSVAIVPALAMTTLTLPNGTVGNPYAPSLVATGGTGTYDWSVIAGALPAGVTLTAAGVLSGTPSTVANYGFTLRVTSGSQSVERAFAIIISPADAASTEITPAATSLELGDSTQLGAVAKDAGGVVLPGRPIAWTSLNGAVASVSGSGLVRGLGIGSVGIVATASGAGGSPVSDTAIVTVVPRPVDSVEVVPNRASLLVGEQQQLSATMRDRFGNVLTGRTVTWSSSDANIASIDANTGLVTSGASGTATITALSEGITGTGDVLVSRGLILTSVVGGDRHSCGLTEASLVFCWGRNLDGQLGDSSNVDRLNPVRVRGSTSYASVIAGLNHTCALTSGGAAWCWGFNQAGRLGDNTTDSRTTPVAVSGGITFASLSAGTHTCGLTASGVAYCWGLNGSGQLGDNTTNNRFVPTLVQGGFTFASISAGDTHTCALTAAGAAYCWGLNSAGQIGDGTFGTTNNRIVPTAVTGGHTFLKLSAGNSHTCGIADDGLTYCWGSNGSVASGTAGRLGDGTTIAQRVVPTPVAAGGVQFTDVIAGGVQTCARTATGLVYCWGANDAGQLGDGTFTSRTSPVPLFGGLTWDAFGLGNFHGCAIRDQGRSFCWGQNNVGAVGDGTVANRNVPVPVRP